MNQVLESQQTPHILPSQVSYRVSIAKIWGENLLRHNGTALYELYAQVILNKQRTFKCFCYCFICIKRTNWCILSLWRWWSTMIFISCTTQVLICHFVNLLLSFVAWWLEAGRVEPESERQCLLDTVHATWRHARTAHWARIQWNDGTAISRGDQGK